jgi:lipopolysaccharide transport system ATP-binding protein
MHFSRKLDVALPMYSESVISTPISDDDAVVSLVGLSKCYRIYDSPHHRLMQGLFGSRRSLYREYWALRDFNLKVGKGESIGIIGRNGSGKSTLLQLICGTVTATHGSVDVRGRIAALLELGAGFNPEFTGRENAYMNASILGMSRAEIEERFDRIESFAEIGKFMDQPVKTYSSGMYVRLAFSVAIHVDPKLLIVDEALAVGDARFQIKCLNRIKSLRESGVTILYVSHDVSSVRTLCDRAVWLDGGITRMSGSVFPVTAQYMEYLFDASETPVDEVGGGGKVDLEKDLEGMNRHRPINHWGSHVGCIHEAGVFDERGARRDAFHDRDAMEIRVSFSLPPGASTESLSVAVSIKDLKGTDLIVSATADQDAVSFDEGKQRYEVSFKLDNCLNTGQYLLVVALEERAGPSIQYYEYIEGAHYFSSIQSRRLFGQFLPVIEQSLLSDGSSKDVQG